MVNLTIDGKEISVKENTTILKAAMQAGVVIPTLCYYEKLNEIGACRMCVVEMEGRDRLPAACNTPVEEGMVIHTNTPRVRAARRTNLQLILSQHRTECTTCFKNGNCKLQDLSKEYCLTENEYPTEYKFNKWNREFPLIRDNTKCIKCMRCIQVCEKMQSLNVWDLISTGSRTEVGVTQGKLPEKLDCSLCGQCITHCPVGALTERDDIGKVLRALADPEVTVVAQIAPAVRTGWGDELGLSREEATVGRIAAALKKIGFNYVFDTSFSADLTIMEEGSELIERLKKAGTEEGKKKLPMFTSCCPGWVRFIRSQYPDMVGQLSSAKSPQQMFGAVIKNYWAPRAGVDPAKVFSVSVMPCTAKKAEQDIEGMNAYEGGRDIDAVLTVRELVKLLRSEMIYAPGLPEEKPDSPLGEETGSGVIFGATGGVMEAALRSAYCLVTGKNPDADAFKEIRGIADGWKEAQFDLGGTKLRIAVASGLGNARNLIEAVRAGKVSYDFIEIMACPGGCAGGGGQPILDGFEQAAERGQVLYGLDKLANIRFSHENPEVQALYKEYYGAPLSEKAHHELHHEY